MSKKNRFGGRKVLNEFEDYNLLSNNNLTKSFVVNTLTEDCSLKCESLDQIGIFNCNASARKSASDLCDINFLAFDLNIFSTFLSSIISGSRDILNKNLDFDMFDFEQINLEYFFNSSISFSGENNLILCFANISLVNDSDLNRENTMFVSIINSINSPYLCFEMSALNFLPNLIQSSSVNLEFSKSFSNFFNINNLLTFSDRNSLISSDQFISGNCSMFCFNGSGIDNVTFFILIPPQYLINTQDTQIYKCLGYGDFLNTSEIIIDFVTLTVSNVFPNGVDSERLNVNFTYNVSDAGLVADVSNCSLCLEKNRFLGREFNKNK